MGATIKNKQRFFRNPINQMKNHSQGFTLVEVMVSVLISTVILEAIYTMVLIGQRSWNDYSNNLIPKEEVRRGLISMVSELREAHHPVIVQDAHKTSIN